MNPVAEDILMHYGTKRHSGRYPWGSGDNPYQHSGDFLSRVESLKKKGLSEKEIADTLNLSTTQLRAYKQIAKQERRAPMVEQAKQLRSEGKSLKEIASIMGFKNDSSVRTLLNEETEKRATAAMKTRDILKKVVDEKGMIDVGEGVEREIPVTKSGVSKEKLNEALTMLEGEGYVVYSRGVRQVTNPDQQTIMKVLCKPGTEYKDVYDGKIESFSDYYHSYDDGASFRKAFEYPSSLDSKRLQIRYAEEGGLERDGTIEIRRGVKDLSLGESNYAQVRIMVDDTHYLKGMALYADDLPPGVDVRFNTNKTQGTPMTKVLKEIKSDPDNPFGALIKESGGQYYYDDPNGKYTDPITGNKQSLGLVNKTREEGDWESWGDTLPSQFLAKQSMKLMTNQLKLTQADYAEEYETIKSLENPTIRKAQLMEFADKCDTAAEELKAAALPRQKYQVIIPVPSLKDNEIYAPNFKDGETVALVRFPHGGTFEIPILKVNKKNKEGIEKLGPNAMDAVGINSKVAERLSGADFDGDTVMVIPCNSSRSGVKITATEPLEGLKGFDPKAEYPEREGMTYMKDPKTGKDNTGREMGIISNLITDMTLQGAPPKDLARAVRHSMVVIDAAKHKLDYKQSEIDNGIAELKHLYQGHPGKNGKEAYGASTLISRASSEVDVLKRKGSPHVNVEDSYYYDPSKPKGSLVYQEVREEFVNPKTGKTQVRTQKSTKMKETSDAMTLVSEARTPQELVYAEHANKMKAFANQARLDAIATPNLKKSSSAAKVYANEVSELMSQLNIAKKNAPRERMAQYAAGEAMKLRKQDNPYMSKADIKKAAQQELTKARLNVGAHRTSIRLTDRQWEAIQAGAVSDNVLKEIIRYTDPDDLKQRAMPKQTKALSEGKINRIKALAASGYTNGDIAEIIGVSPSTVSAYLKGKK